MLLHDTMVRKILLLVLLLPLLLFAACSYGYEFVVANKSAGPIEVRYQLKRWTPETPGKFVDLHPPAKLTEGEFQKSEHQWREVPKEQFAFDNLTGTYTVTLAPDEVLLLQRTSNYQGIENQFYFARIKISGSKGTIDLEGWQAQTQFKIESDTKYVIRYR
jgi:hypothetical protein